MSVSTVEVKHDPEDSDDGLKIVIESPTAQHRRAKAPSPIISPQDAELISTVANELDKELDEKATKANLSESSVKKIIKHVVTNEHVVALVRQADNPDSSGNELPIFEPKLTRAKAKELFPTGAAIPPIHWKRKPKPSKVHALISEELQEDSSGDEYIPGEEDDEEEEEEEDKDGSVYSESEPATPKNADCGTQTNWSEDGFFKIPQPMTKAEEEEVNIARRTRSKLSLSETPLEKITETFPPDPDIELEPDSSSDICEMDYDDDWKEFLEKFMKPLDEAIKEDEDQDPEYNILAEKEQLDKEELREDKGVKISKKELNQLIAELFECENFYVENFNLNAYGIEEAQKSSEPRNLNKEPEGSPQYIPTITINESANIPYIEPEPQQPEPIPEITTEMITAEQKTLLEQQMRQHVQLLTQHFLLLYEHPENAELGLKCKEYLYNLRDLPANKTGSSYFIASNLNSALNVVENWEKKFKENGVEVEKIKSHVTKMLHNCKKYKDCHTKFIPTFPPLLMDTVLKSDAFLYPFLLPKIPFRPNRELKVNGFTKSEVELIAIGLEQFIPFAKQDPFHLKRKGEVRLMHVCSYIQRYMLPVKETYKIYKFINMKKGLNAEMNPIKYFYMHNMAPIMSHYVMELDKSNPLPPIDRNLDEMPYQWRIYVKPELAKQPDLCLSQTSTSTDSLQMSFSHYVPTYQAVPGVLVPVYSIVVSPATKQSTYKDFVNKRRRLLPKPIKKCTPAAKRRIQFNQSGCGRYFSDFCARRMSTSTPNAKKLDEHFKCVNLDKSFQSVEGKLRKFKFNSSIFRKSCHLLKMLPSMPSLNTPRRESPELSEFSYNEEKSDSSLSFVGIQNVEVQDGVQMQIDEKSEPETLLNTNCQETEVSQVQEVVKDNLEDINALMVASSTIKPATRKKVASTGEKKKAKQIKEITANLVMLSPQTEQDMEEKTNRFVQSYYDKLNEQLDLHDYHQIIEVLNNFEPSQDSVSNLYYNVDSILSPKHPDLADEFLSFLTASQAKAVGKLVPYLLLNNMSLFLKKLEMYFKDQPLQVKKIYRAITDLTECLDVNMGKISATILPLLKGNKMLIDWFLQIFPSEKPTESMLSGSWETVDIPKEPLPTNEEPYEIVTLPDYDDPYGGPNCICSCHENPNDNLFKSRARHCPPCGTRFIQGRVYINTGKGLRHVKVTFNNEAGSDPYARLGCPPIVQNKKKSDNSPSKVHNTAKDHHDEIRLSNDSEEDDCSKKKAKGKSPRKRKSKPKVERAKKGKKEHAAKMCKAEKVNVENAELQMNVDEAMEENVQVKCNSRVDQKEDIKEWNCGAEIESLELRLSPEPSAESESGETSQDNLNTDSDSSIDSQANETGNSSGDDSWTKDEDKTILETLQKRGHKEETFVYISGLLESRSVAKVKSRFQLLMKLIQEMATKKM